MNLKKRIKDIAKEEAKLARERKALSDQLENAAALDSKLDALIKSSGYKTPRALVDAIIAKYSLRMGKRKEAKKAAKAVAVAAPVKAPAKAVRKKTRKVAVKKVAAKAVKKAKAAPKKAKKVKAVAAPAKARRKRTKITAKLRDSVLKAIKGGLSKNGAAKKFQLSYAVVGKMEKGVYSKLK